MKKENDRKTIFKMKGRPNLISDDFMKKIKTNMIGTQAAGTVISRRIVMAIGNGVVRSNSPTLLKENGGSLELTKDWARGVIKSVNWTKRKGTTGKIEPSKQFLLEEKLTFQKKISGVTLEKSLSFFNKIVFPHFKNARKAKGYPDEQMSLIIVDNFKGQGNDLVAKRCQKKQMCPYYCST